MDDQIWGYKKESGLPELPEVGKLQVKNAAWPMPMESHPDAVEFLLLRSGCKQIQVEDRLYEMQGGDLLVVFPGERHGAEDFVQNRTSLAYLLMAVPTEVPRFCMLEEEERSALWEQLKLLKGRMLKVSPSICRTMDRLFDHVNTGLPLERARIRTELMRFLFQILEEAGEEDKSLPADIAAVIRYIREAREEMPDIAKMAALVNLSESRFKQKFKQATGIPPAEFTVREKIRESQTLLKDPARTVTSIAMELGFSSSQHFSVLFRKYTGLSPIQYRQNHEFVS